MHHRYLIGTLFQEQQQIKKTNINNIKVKDPNGNVRWKGAFTGGFQAGYKNTCGSKQGWTPATFVSSVSKRAQKNEQNIFDYMDKQDLGRQTISSNIALKNDFKNIGKNSLNVRIKQSVGQKILQKLKKDYAFSNAPQNIQDLDKLLQKYAKQQIMGNQNVNYQFYLKDINFHHSIGDMNTQFQDDEFIANYQDFFKKVIRDRAKQQTEEQIAKRRQQNRVYFDFNKPLQEEPQYLKEIQQIEETSKPRKRKKNALNQNSISSLFTNPISMKQFQITQELEKAPSNYDPYHRLRSLKQKQRQKIKNMQKKQQVARPKIYNLQQRSNILGQPKLSDKFRSSSSNNTFVQSNQKSIQNQNKNQLKKYFEDQKKNERYHDYVLQIQGNKISAQFQYESWEAAQKQKQQFEQMYRLQGSFKYGLSSNNNNGNFKKDVDRIISFKNQQDGSKKKQITINRTVAQWKPDRVLCKRFNVLYPNSQ